MVRESRHLKVQGLSNNITVDQLKEQFGRYGPIEKVTIVPKKDGDEGCTALVDFVDIKSATTAHETVNVVDGREVQTEYNETASVSRTQGKNRQDRQHESDRKAVPDQGNERSSKGGDVKNRDPSPRSRGFPSRDGGDRRQELRVLVVRNVSDNHTERSLCEGLFHEFKKHGEVWQVRVRDDKGERYAVVEFKRAVDANNAMEATQGRTFFGCEMKISLTNCSVLAGFRNERGFRGRGRRYHAFGGHGDPEPMGRGMPGPVPGHGHLQVTVEQDVDELDEEFHPLATRTLFVGNVDKGVTANDLRSVFSRFGEILEVDIKSQRQSIYAFIQFDDMTSACRAKALMNGQLIGRTYCKVGFGHRVVTHTLWLGGVGGMVTQDELARKCSQFGTVLEVAINARRAAALVHFDCKDSAVAAADKLRGKMFHGQRLKVDFANRNSRSAFYKALEHAGGDGRDVMYPFSGPPRRPPFPGDFPPFMEGGFFPGGGPGPGPGPGRGRALFTRHFREAYVDEDDGDYDRELRNFGYQRERERQRQRARQQQQWRHDGDNSGWEDRGMDHDMGSLSDDSGSHSSMSGSGSDDDDDSQSGCNPNWPELRTGRFGREGEKRPSSKKRPSASGSISERTGRSQTNSDRQRRVVSKHQNRLSQSHDHKDEEAKARKKSHQSRGESSAGGSVDDDEVGERQGQACLSSPAESSEVNHGSHRGSPRHHNEDHRASRTDDSGRRRDGHSRSSRTNSAGPVNREGEASDRRETPQRRERSPLDRSRISRSSKPESRASGNRTRARSRSRSPLGRTDKHTPSHSSKTDSSRRARHSPVHQSPREESHWARPPSPLHYSHRRTSASDDNRHKAASSDHATTQLRPPSPAKSPPPPPPGPAPESSVVPQVYSGPTTYAVTAVPAQSGAFVYSTQSGQQLVAEMLPTGGTAHVVAPSATYVTGGNQPLAVSTGEHLDSSARHTTNSLAMRSQQVTVIQNAQPLPLATPPAQQADALLGLLQRYPVMWQGHIALKNDVAAVQMHFLSGSQRLAQIALPQLGANPSTATLRIAQRMRLEQSQLDGVARRMQADMEHCLLLALPCGRDPLDVHAQTRALRTGFISYLQQKQAAGIINVQSSVAQNTGGYVLHIFPPCDFTQQHVARVAPDLLSSAADSGHLMIVIAVM